MTSTPIQGASPPDIAAALAEPTLAAALAGGAAVLLATGFPAKVVFANAAMLGLFGVRDVEALTNRLFAAADPGARRLVELSRILPAGAPPRLERLRFYIGRRAETFILMCRRTGSAAAVAAARPDFFVVAAAAPRPTPVGDVPAAPLAPSAAEAEPAMTAPPESASMAEPAATEAPAGAPRLRSPEEVGRDLADRFGGARTIRFLWQTGPDRCFTKITGQLCEAVGCVTGDLIGQDFTAVAERLDLDPDGRLRDALARSETWSGVQILWPVEHAAAALPVILGALPAFDRQRRFEGFRGFGVIHVEPVARALAAKAGADEPAAPAAPAACQPAPEAADADKAATEAPAAPLASPLGENVVPLRPHQGQTRAAFAVVKDISKDNALVPAPPMPREGPAAPGAEESTELSSNERLAFREIARTIASHVAAEGEGAALPPVCETVQPSPPSEETGDLMEAGRVAEPPPAGEGAAGHVRHEPASHDLAALFDRLPVGLLVSRFGVPVFVNRTLLDWLDHRDAESFLINGGLTQMFGGEPAQRLSEDTSDRAILVKTRTGECVAVEARLQTIEWDGAAATLMTLRRADNADQASRLATLELELRRAETESRQLRAILDTATDGVAVLDREGRIVSLNRSGEALFGYDQNEVAGEPFTILLAKESHAAAVDYLAGLQSSNVASLLGDGREVTGRARQGGAIPLFMALGRIGSDGEPKFCAVLRDVTQWKKAERELSNARREAERVSALKSDFLAKVSHEIRTPLNAILGFAEVITQERFGPIGNERYKDYLKDIHASGEHVMSLVNDLLDLSKIEAGKLELDFAHVDANRVVSECVSLMQPQANRERVIVRLSLASRLPQIVADERSLRQIVLNLLSNAIKFNEPGGQVIVSTTLTDSGQAVIRIRDTGIGMSESDVITALEPFRQIATSRNTTGTGLGLPLTKALVEANRAHFSIKSKKTEGTLVEVAFPPTRVLAAE
jgi:PAS domain S-box-containing protein